MYTMYSARNMAARNNGSSARKNVTNPSRNTAATSTAATSRVTRSTTATASGNVTSTLTTKPSRLFTTSATVSEASTLAEPIYFILLVDKEVQISGSDSLPYQRHAPSSKRILKGSLLQVNEVLPHRGQSYGDVVKGSKRTDAKRYVVKPLSGYMQFECSSFEIGRITGAERDLLQALSTNSDRLNIYQDRDLIPYALGLKEGSSVKVRHRNDGTSPYEEVAALVRYIGPLSGFEMGTQFGLELMDDAYRGQGTSDGVFGKCRYFQTDPDCAVFVPISKLVPPSTSQGAYLYKNVPRSKQELPNQPSELPSVGDIIKGTTVYLQVGNSMRRGRVVYMIVPHKETEPYATVEMPKQDGDRMWNGMHRGYHVFTPRNEVFTKFVPANNLTTLAPEEYQDLYSKKPSPSLPSKAKNKGKKPSEPFWAANNKPRKTPAPYSSSGKLEKGSHKPSGGRRDASESFYPDFGDFASPLVEGFIDPPARLGPEFVGMQKGIQGYRNSCYLDSALFSMFAYNGVFDLLLRRMQGQGDLQEYEKVQKTLRESIVNPLRKNGFVRADRILQLREHLDQLGTTKGLMSEEKDPEEFLHTLLSEVFKSRPLLKIRHGGNQAVDESNIHQIFLEKDESLTLPTVEQLLLQSFQEHDLKLVEAPSCLIVQMPRFGKDYKMYNRILPSLQLDVTNIIEEYPRQCTVCGNLAVFECSECKSEEALEDDTIPIKNYCDDCFNMMHVGTRREHHKPTLLTVPDYFLKEFFSKTVEKHFSAEEVDEHCQKLLTPKLMDLFAVICIRSSRYVAFVKAGREMDSEWVFFDSMADRQGDQQGYYIPQITHLKDFRKWVDVGHIKARIEGKQLTEIMERLLGDAYICMYFDSEQRHQTYV